MKQSLPQCVPETPTLRPDGTNKNTGALSPVSSVAKRNREYGVGHMKSIVLTMIIVAFIYVTAMTIPVLINEYQFQDSLDQIARFSSVDLKPRRKSKKADLAGDRK